MTRHLAIGDIHGCFDALSTLIETVAPSSDDIIVTLGDYVDRGPDSRAVLDLIIELQASHTVVALRGNHEIMMLDAKVKKSWLRPWLTSGGYATLQSYASSADKEGRFTDIPDSHFDFLQNDLVPYYECETHFFVHANAAASVALAEQAEADLYWRRLGEPAMHCSGKIMVCGHTPQESGIPFFNGNAVGIDTWAFGDGWLSCLDVESGIIWQANSTCETRQLSLDDILLR